MWRKVSEMVFNWAGGLRFHWPNIAWKFWDTGGHIRMEGVSMEMARSLYRNDSENANLGSAFARPIIDTTVNFMGLPTAVSGETVDEFVNEAIHNHWAPQIQELFRNTLRDSRCIVRIRRHQNTILVDPEEARFGLLEVLDPMTVELIYSPTDPEWIDKAICTYEIEVEQEKTNPNNDTFEMPQVEMVTIREEVTPESFRYWDESQQEWLDDWETKNVWGFVPFVEIFNEWDSYLHGGQSDLEGPLPFMKAFHDVMDQTLKAHKYHSIPKAKFKINDLMPFLANNFPDSFERTEGGQPDYSSFTGKVNWSGNEILFLAPDEDAGFLEAKSVLGDSKVLLEFLMECVSIASETPRWAFMVASAGEPANTAESLPLVKKVERKRTMFENGIQRLIKMILVANRGAPTFVPLSWEEVNPQDMISKAQSLQQVTMSLELALQRKLISDKTAAAHLRRQIPEMKEPGQEMRDAENNRVLLIDNPNAAQTDPTKNGKTKVGQQGANE